MPYQKEARPRYQRQPRNMPKRARRNLTPAMSDLLVAAFAVAASIAIVWSLGGMYQIGYEAGCEYAQSKAVAL